jgi:hypothetical protein
MQSAAHGVKTGLASGMCAAIAACVPSVADGSRGPARHKVGILILLLILLFLLTTAVTVVAIV